MTENGTNQSLSGWGWRVSLFLSGIVFTLGGVWIVHPVSEEGVRQIVREEVARLIEATGPYSREREALIMRLNRGDQDRSEMAGKLDEIAKDVRDIAKSQSEMNGRLGAILNQAHVRH